MSSVLVFILILVSLASAVASFAALYQLTRNAEQEIQDSYDRLEKRLSENIDKHVKEFKELVDEEETKWAQTKKKFWKKFMRSYTLVSLKDCMLLKGNL